jgi:3-deoxy-D-manno-octulosonic-acid transferase
MRTFQPKLVVILETEIWPNLFNYCGKHNIPLYIINARLSDKSVVRYQKLPSLFHPALANVTCIATQSDEDSERFIAIGAATEKVKNLGNIKFDVEIPTENIERVLELKKQIFANRFILLVASTHKDEETVFLQIYSALKTKIPELLLIIVPRHLQRFQDVYKICVQQGFSVALRSSPQAVDPNIDIYIVDTMGELKMFYAVADVAFVAGSITAVGGHNILEPAAVGVPILFGPYMTNFKEIAALALKKEAAIQCQTQQEIIDAVITLYEQPNFRETLVARAKIFVKENQGAINRVCKLLEASIY